MTDNTEKRMKVLDITTKFAVDPARLLHVRTKTRSNLVLFASLLLFSFVYPVLDHNNATKLFMAIVVFGTLVPAAVAISPKRSLLWPVAILAAAFISLGAVDSIGPDYHIRALQWAILTICFVLIVAGLFSYLGEAGAVTNDRLYASANVYLLLAMLWFSLYSTIEELVPGSLRHATTGTLARPSDLLNFSLATLTTLGYGDVRPVSPLVTTLAALEAIAGILYIAITVARLVAMYKHRD